MIHLNIPAHYIQISRQQFRDDAMERRCKQNKSCPSIAYTAKKIFTRWLFRSSILDKRLPENYHPQTIIFHKKNIYGEDQKPGHVSTIVHQKKRKQRQLKFDLQFAQDLCFVYICGTNFHNGYGTIGEYLYLLKKLERYTSSIYGFAPTIQYRCRQHFIEFLSTSYDIGYKSKKKIGNSIKLAAITKKTVQFCICKRDIGYYRTQVCANGEREKVCAMYKPQCNVKHKKDIQCSNSFVCPKCTACNLCRFTKYY